MAIAKSAAILMLCFALAIYADAAPRAKQVGSPDIYKGKNVAQDVLLPVEKLVDFTSFGAIPDGETDNNARRSLASTLVRALSSSSSSATCTTSRSRFASALLATKQSLPLSGSVKFPVRTKSSGSGYSPLNDPSPNWSNRPPKETILLDGCDYEHWLIVMEFPDNPKPSEDDMVNAYVKTLTQVLGSEEEAKKKIYSVSTSTYTGFGALISEELSYKVKELPGVLWVLPDSYLDVPNKDYGGDLFVDGKVIPRPQYRYSERQTNNRNRPRPRHDRRRETMQVERREPLQRQNWSQGQGGPMQQSTSMHNQNSASGGQNQPMFNRNTA